MDVLSFYERNKLKVWALFLLGIPAFIVLGCLLFPEIFWHSFIWKYFWGPVVADAQDQSINEVSEGYNIVNTITYGICILVAFLGIYELVGYFDIKIDKKFLVSLFPWVVLGGSLRSLEDVGLFEEPLNQFFISPIIYFVLGISAIVSMLIGAYFSEKDYDHKKEVLFRGILSLPVLAILFIINNYFTESLFIPYLLLSVSLVIVTITGLYRRWLNETYLFILYGCSVLVFTLSYNYHYIISLEGTNPSEAVIIPLISVGVTILFLGIWKIIGMIRGKDEITKVFLGPLNILIAWSHLFDASATYRGMEFYGYLEKHVLPSFFIGLTGTSLVMYVLKLVLIIAVIYLIDIVFREEFIEYPYLRNLIKFVIIVLGAAPAVRNTLRLAMGV